jgi:hypothetical protein
LIRKENRMSKLDESEKSLLTIEHLTDKNTPKDFIDLEIDGIDARDYPEMSDAYICSATAILPDGSTREATDVELEKLTEDSGDWINEMACLQVMGG